MKFLQRAMLFVMAFISHAAAEDQVLGGIEGLACQAVLCLSTSSPPGECAAALNHYYSIKGKNSDKTAALRRAFLARCPYENAPDIDSVIAGMAETNVVEDAPTYSGNYYNVYDTAAGDAYRSGGADVADDRGLYIQNGSGFYEKAITEGGKVYLTDPISGERVEYVLRKGAYVPVGTK